MIKYVNETKHIDGKNFFQHCSSDEAPTRREQSVVESRRRRRRRNFRGQLLLQVSNPGPDESSTDEADARGSKCHGVRLRMQDAIFAERSTAIGSTVASYKAIRTKMLRE